MSRCSINASSEPSLEEIQQADRLVARMTGGSARQRRQARAALDAWAARSPAHAAHYTHTLQVCTVLDASLDALRQRYPLPARPAARWHLRLVPAAWALAVLLLFGGAAWITNPVLEQQQIATAKGERREVRLADGSRIVLNTDSQIRSQIRLRSRRVELVRGQAYFDVIHSRWRPFKVDIGTSQVSVLGTAFDIRRDDPDCAVTVLRGLVSVTSASDPEGLQLLAGERVQIHADRLQPPDRFDQASALLWQSGKLRLTGLTLKQAIAELQRYQSAPIQVAAEVAQLPLSGTVSIDSPEHVLDMLAVAFPLDIHRRSDGRIEVLARQPTAYFDTHSAKPVSNRIKAPPARTPPTLR